VRAVSATTAVKETAEGIRRIELPIAGLTCANCVQAVQRALLAVPGVRSATVNLVGERSFVDFDPARTTVAALHDTVKQAGYQLGPARARFRNPDNAPMWVIVASLLVAVLGVGAARVGLASRFARAGDRDPHVYWVLGLLAPVPAWLIVFWILLGPSPKLRPEIVSDGSWILSTAAGLIGAILTEGLVRRRSESGTDYPPLAYWRLGLFGSAPAWGITLLGYALKTIIG
jgi:copper chaperone CopZ